MKRNSIPRRFTSRNFRREFGDTKLLERIALDDCCSSVDPETLGSGTKLPHNVVALAGTMNGASAGPISSPASSQSTTPSAASAAAACVSSNSWPTRDDYHAALSRFVHAGVHSNGESYLGHINQTLTGLVFA